MGMRLPRQRPKIVYDGRYFGNAVCSRQMVPKERSVSWRSIGLLGSVELNLLDLRKVCHLFRLIQVIVVLHCKPALRRAA